MVSFGMLPLLVEVTSEGNMSVALETLDVMSSWVVEHPTLDAHLTGKEGTKHAPLHPILSHPTVSPFSPPRLSQQ